MLHESSARRRPQPAAELLFATARPRLDAASANRAHAALSQGVDWAGFTTLASMHGVAPLLHQHLSGGALDSALFPPAVLAELHGEAERIALRSIFLAGELVTLLRAFADEEMLVVPLKGPQLALQLYGSVALRRFNDLDLFVATGELARAARILEDRGYRRAATLGSRALDRIAQADDAHLTLYASGKTHRVELHDHLSAPLGVGRDRRTFASARVGLEQVTFFGASAWRLRPEELLAYLCTHGAKHDWGRIEWLAAVAELLRGGRVTDWDRVRAFSRRIDGDRALDAGMQLASELIDVSVPPLQRRADWMARAAVRSVALRLRGDPLRVPRGVELVFDQVRLETGIRNQAARLCSALVVPKATDIAAIRLPGALWRLYYALRPVRILWRALHRLVRPSP